MSSTCCVRAQASYVVAPSYAAERYGHKMKQLSSNTEKAAKLLYGTMIVAMIVLFIICIFLVTIFIAGILNPERVNKYIADPSLFFGGSLPEFFLMIFLYICNSVFWIVITGICILISQSTIKNGSPFTAENTSRVCLIYKVYLLSIVIWYLGVVFLLPLFGGVIGLHNLKLSKIAVLLVFYFVTCIFDKAKDLQIENDETL